MLDYDATATLAGLRLPVLIVAGDRDHQTIPEASAHMRAAMPAGPSWSCSAPPGT